MAHEIRDESTGSDLLLALYADGARVAAARASGEVLAQMQTELGRARPEVETELRAALEKLHVKELEKVSLSAPREQRPRGLRFVASYLYRDFGDLSAGLVWYDVKAGTTGPDDAPTFVRNKLRYAVHGELVKGSAAAEELMKVVR